MSDIYADFVNPLRHALGLTKIPHTCERVPETPEDWLPGTEGVPMKQFWGRELDLPRPTTSD